MEIHRVVNPIRWSLQDISQAIVNSGNILDEVRKDLYAKEDFVNSSKIIEALKIIGEAQKLL